MAWFFTPYSDKKRAIEEAAKRIRDKKAEVYRSLDKGLDQLIAASSKHKSELRSDGFVFVPFRAKLIPPDNSFGRFSLDVHTLKGEWREVLFWPLVQISPAERVTEIDVRNNFLNGHAKYEDDVGVEPPHFAANGKTFTDPDDALSAMMAGIATSVGTRKKAEGNLNTIRKLLVEAWLMRSLYVLFAIAVVFLPRE